MRTGTDTSKFVLLTTGVLGALWISALLLIAHTVLFLIMVVTSLLVGLVLSLTVYPRIFSPKSLIIMGIVLAFFAPYWFLIAGGPVFFVALSLFLLGIVAWTWGAGRIVRESRLTQP